MFYEGVVIGLATFMIIGLFHPIVIKSEYHFGTKCWWAFLLMGIIGISVSLIIRDTFTSAIIAVFAFSSFWSILEIFEQRERVNKGWFPANPKRRNEYKIISYNYRYPHPAITADCLLFALKDSKVEILLIQRGGEPQKGFWALPGGFMEINETTESCAKREIFEETGVTVSDLKEVGAYSDVDRDPRERVVTITYCTLAHKDSVSPKAGDDAQNIKWFAIDSLPELAFDHNKMVTDSVARMKREILLANEQPEHIYNKEFSDSELNEIYKELCKIL